MRRLLVDFLHHNKRSSISRVLTHILRDLQRALVLSHIPRLDAMETAAWSGIGRWRFGIQSQYTTGLGNTNLKYSFKTTRPSRRSHPGVRPRGVPNEQALPSNRKPNFMTTRVLRWMWEAIPGESESETMTAAIARKAVIVVQPSARRRKAHSRPRRRKSQHPQPQLYRENADLIRSNFNSSFLTNVDTA